MGLKFRKVSIEDALKGAKQNEYKFSAERNGKYNVYFPSTEALVVAKVHEWRIGGKYNSVACTNEADCPFCAAEHAGWEEYRAKIGAATAGLDPVLDKEEISKRKKALVPAITSSDKIYQLVGIVTPADKKAGTPESYALKILNLSQQRLESFKSYAEETSESGGLCGATLLLKYPDEENARDRGKNMQILPGKAISEETKNAIDKAAEEFNWEQGLSGFYEFRDMSDEDKAKAIRSAGFEAVETDDEEEIPFEEKATETKATETKAAPVIKKSDDDDDDDGGNGGDGSLDDLDDLV